MVVWFLQAFWLPVTFENHKNCRQNSIIWVCRHSHPRHMYSLLAFVAGSIKASVNYLRHNFRQNLFVKVFRQNLFVKVFRQNLFVKVFRQNLFVKVFRQNLYTYLGLLACQGICSLAFVAGTIQVSMIFLVLLPAKLSTCLSLPAKFICNDLPARHM